MASFQQLMNEFLDKHKAYYIGKYKHRASYQIGDYITKCHYYMLDENFRRIDIYVEVHYQDEIKYTFSEKLHDQEQIYIVTDILKRLNFKSQYPTMLHYSLYESFVKNENNHDFQLKPMDYCNILDYMKYHGDISQQTIDKFYDIFIPCLMQLIERGQYKQFLQSINLLIKSVLYEYEWDGITAKYLDTEYQYHSYFIRKIIRIVYEHLDKFMSHAMDELMEAIKMMCDCDRFSFIIMTDFGNLVLSDDIFTKALIKKLKTEFILNDKDEERKNVNLVFSYLYYIYMNDYDQYKSVLLKLLRKVVNNMLTLANSDLDLALGNSIIKMEGYEILLDLFRADYNTFVFTCFPIKSFPQEMIPAVRRELEGAVQFFAARMENDKYRLSSFEQVLNINRLLLDNFKGWYK
jgi:hypothetical protein